MLFVITNPEDKMDSLPIVTPGCIVEFANSIKLFLRDTGFENFFILGCL